MELDFTKDPFEFRRVRRKPREITMIPLINIIFLLLIFFLVAGTVEKFDPIPLEVPEAESGKLLDEGHISVLLGANSVLMVNEEKISAQALQEKMEGLLQHNKNRIITFKADANLPAKEMIDVLNTIKRAGGVNISFVTQRKVR